MTTVIDPLGTPVVVYNKSGSVIIPLAASGTSALTGAPIPYVCGHQIVLVTTGVNQNAALLPQDAEVGDITEVVSLNDDTRVFAGGSDYLNGSANGVVFIQNTRGGGRFIKTSANGWHSIGQP